MKIEIRADNSVHISGYVNAVGRDSRVLASPRGKFVEQVEPRAFADALTRNPAVKLMHNHRRDVTGSLSLREDNIGLYAEADTTDSEIIAEARAGNLRGWSFGFRSPVDDWEKRENDVPRRHLRAFDLDEVSIIDNRMTPCYIGTSIETRAEGDIISETRAGCDDAISIVDSTPKPSTIPDYTLEINKIRLMRMRGNEI